MAFATIDVTKGITGTIPVANGGTGLTSGTTDQILKFTGTTTLASSSISTGKILQVQFDNKQSTGSSTALASSGNWTDLLSVNITPSAASSKIMITAMVNTGASNSSDATCLLKCLRDSTQIANGTASGSRISTTSGKGTDNQGGHTQLMETVVWVDSPNSTSEITYKVQFAKRGTGGGTAYVGQSYDDSNDAEEQRTPCNLTLMEIGA